MRRIVNIVASVISCGSICLRGFLGFFGLSLVYLHFLHVASHDPIFLRYANLLYGSNISHLIQIFVGIGLEVGGGLGRLDFFPRFAAPSLPGLALVARVACGKLFDCTLCLPELGKLVELIVCELRALVYALYDSIFNSFFFSE